MYNLPVPVPVPVPGHCKFSKFTKFTRKISQNGRFWPDFG